MTVKDSRLSNETTIMSIASKWLADDWKTAIKVWNDMPHDAVKLSNEQLDEFNKNLQEKLELELWKMNKKIKGGAKSQEMTIVFLDPSVSNALLADTTRKSGFSQTKIPPESFALIYMNENHLLVRSHFSEFDVDNQYVFQGYSTSDTNVSVKNGWEEAHKTNFDIPTPRR